MAWEALFLRETAFAEMREQSRPTGKGVVLVVLVAVVVALAGLAGPALEWATSPRLADIQDVVLANIQEVDWYRQADRTGLSQAVSL